MMGFIVGKPILANSLMTGGAATTLLTVMGILTPVFGCLGALTLFIVALYKLKAVRLDVKLKQAELDSYTKTHHE